MWVYSSVLVTITGLPSFTEFYRVDMTITGIIGANNHWQVIETFGNGCEVVVLFGPWNHIPVPSFTGFSIVYVAFTEITDANHCLLTIISHQVEISTYFHGCEGCTVSFTEFYRVLPSLIEFYLISMTIAYNNPTQDNEKDWVPSFTELFCSIPFLDVARKSNIFVYPVKKKYKQKKNKQTKNDRDIPTATNWCWWRGWGGWLEG